MLRRVLSALSILLPTILLSGTAVRAASLVRTPREPGRREEFPAFL